MDARSRRVVWGKRIARFVVWTIGVVVFVAVAALVTVNLPGPKRLVLGRVNSVLENVVAGKIVVESVGTLSPWGVTEARVALYDPDGTRVVAADGVTSRIDLGALIRSLVSGSGPDIRLSLSSLRHADVNLDADSNGALRLERTFQPKHAAPPEPAGPPASGGVSVHLPEARLAHAWVHGFPAPGVLLDLDAEDGDVAVSFDRTGLLVTVQRVETTLRGLLGKPVIRGHVFGTVVVDTGPTSEPRIEGHFDGDVGGIRSTANARLDGKTLSAQAHARREPGERSALIPVALAAPLVVDATAEGPLDALAIRARGKLGEAAVDLDGSVRTAPELSLAGTAAVERLSLADVVATLPKTALRGAARAVVVIRNGVPTGDFTAVTNETRVLGWDVPSVVATGTLGEHGITARLGARMRGAWLRADVARVASDRPLGVVLRARADDLRPLTSGVVGGAASVFVDGTLDTDSLRVDARVVASGRSVQVPSAAATRAFVDARVTGVAPRPYVDGVFRGEEISVAGRVFPDVALHVRGPLASPSFGVAADGGAEQPSLSASGTLRVGPKVVIGGLTGTAVRGQELVLVGAKELRASTGALEADRVVLVGLGGTATANVSITRSRSRVELDAPRIELRRVARLLGLRDERYYGLVSARASLIGGADGAQGTVKAAFDDVSVEGKTGHGSLAATLRGDHADVDLHGAWDSSELDITTRDLLVEGPVFEPKTWANASGTASAHGDVDLSRLGEWVPRGTLPWSDLRGRAEVFVEFERTPGALPDLSVSVETKELGIASATAPLPSSDGTKVDTSPRFRVQGVDVSFAARCSVARRSTEAHVVLHDEHGALAELGFTGELPPGFRLSHPTDPGVLGQMPFSMTAEVPERRVADFPPPLGRPGHEGTASFSARAQGTVLNPAVELSANISDLHQRHAPARAGVSLSTKLHYADGETKIEGAATHRGRDVARLLATLRAKVPALVAGEKPDFDADVHLALSELPLPLLPALDERRAKGSITGDASLSFGSATDPRARVDLHVDDLSVGRLRENSVVVRALADAHRADAELAVSGSGGSLHATASASPPWPSWMSHDAPARRFAKVSLEAKAFRLATLRPVASTVVSGLDGRLDGAFRVDAAEGSDTTMDGKLLVSGAAFEVPMIGEGLTGVGATVNFERTGTITASDVVASGSSSGKLRGSASATLRGLEFVNARAAVQIPKNDPMPVALEGQVLGEAWGGVRAAVRKEGTALFVAVDLDGMGVSLPEHGTRSLQSLDPAERVVIGHYRGPHDFEALATGGVSQNAAPETGSTMHLAIRAHDVEIRRGTGLRVRIDGGPDVLSAPGREVSVTGSVDVREGFLDVEGKRFEIERGTVRFVGQADNPQVLVTAAWPAPDGTRVYADFSGPLQTGKVTLRSDPPHTKSEILSLILFGTTDGNAAPTGGGSSGSVAQSGTASAASLGGGVAAQGLNKALDDLTGLDVTARVDTSQGDTPRPELEVRVARDISVALAHALGVPAPGSNPDRNFATLDFRFRRHWSLETTFGDAGSSMMDLIWQYRY